MNETASELVELRAAIQKLREDMNLNAMAVTAASLTNCYIISSQLPSTPTEIMDSYVKFLKELMK